MNRGNDNNSGRPLNSMGSGIYTGVGIRGFARSLKSELVDRVDLFVKETEARYSDDPDSLGARSRSQWMNEFQKWSKYKQGVKALAEKYLMGNTPE